jgi:hypothetical protein
VRTSSRRESAIASPVRAAARNKRLKPIPGVVGWQ